MAKHRVYGQHAPPPRLTGAAIRLILLYAGLPVLMAGVLLDVVIWFVGTRAFDVCAALWCWF